MRQSLALPLLNQIAIDGGPIVQKLAEGRLGIEGPPQSVRHQARKLNVTRARIYQLLEMCSKIMDVRWPEGRVALSYYSERFHLAGLDPSALRLFDGVRDLFYPHRPSILFPVDELPIGIELDPTEAGESLDGAMAEASDVPHGQSATSESGESARDVRGESSAAC